MLAPATVRLGILFATPQRSLREVYVHHLAGSARFGGDAGRAGIAEEVEHPSFFAMVAQVATSATQVKKQVRVLAAMVSLDLEGLAHFLNPHRFRRLLRVEQLRGASGTSLPDDQLTHPHFFLTPALQNLPVQVQNQRTEKLQQDKGSVTIQG